MKVHKPEEIQVGVFYNHPTRFGYKFLGVGMRQLYTADQFCDKHLIIFKSPNAKEVGLMVQEGENAMPEVWGMGFRTEDDEDSFYVIG
jgi:hypothetical protein